MARSKRARRTAIALTVWTQACTVYHAQSGAVPLRTGGEVRVRSDEPFAVSQPASTSVPVTFCRATAVEGDLVSVSGDTLVLARSRNVAVARGLDASLDCPRNERVAVVRTSRMEVMEGRTHPWRTTGLVLGIAAGLGGLLLIALSNSELGPAY